MAKTFRDLIVWQKAHSLALEIYKLTKCFPSEEKYGLVSQMRRAAVSVCANIVEGYKGRSKKDYARFIVIADGSLEELKYYFILGKDLKYIQESDFQDLNKISDEVGRMLKGFHKTLIA